ncbi:anti-sigma factor domain-containing protein [Chitinophagaceae bacterium LWZ2-11]
MNIEAYIQSGAIESYVLGLSSLEERAETAELSKLYPEIKRAIAAFESSLEKDAFANAIVPEPDVKAKLFSSLKDEFVVNHVHVSNNTINKNPAKIIRLKLLKNIAAAAVILLIGSTCLNLYLYGSLKSTNEKYLSLLSDKNSLTADNNDIRAKYSDMYSNLKLMSGPDVLKIAMPGIKGKENDLATVFWNSSTKDVYLLANKLPEAPSDKQYQLWAIVDGKPVDAGLLSKDCNGLCKLKNIPKAQAFAITLEKAGGVQQPTLSELYVMGKV